MNNGMFGLGGAGTLQVNSQLVPVPMGGAFFPSMASAPFYQGSGQPPATVPLNLARGGNSTDSQAAIAVSDPWNPATSPLPIAIAALVIGYLGLRYIHWRG